MQPTIKRDYPTSLFVFLWVHCGCARGNTRLIYTRQEWATLKLLQTITRSARYAVDEYVWCVNTLRVPIYTYTVCTY